MARKVRRVYVVRGSEDGNLGVFSSKKKATMKAVAYCSPDFNEFDAGCEVDEFAEGWHVTVEGYGVSASVERFHIE